jgi:glycosyltransferase involved in cell wall biosynthesis
MQLTLIGQGPEKASLQQIAEACQLPSSVILFVDWLTRSELDQYFATSKLYLFPSHEGAGMVIPEAFSYGLPVVCFDNYGPGELVNDSCAIRIPYSNPEASIAAFSRAIGVYLHDEDFRSKHSENALQVFKNSYTWSRKALVFQAIYDEIATVEESLAMA